MRVSGSDGSSLESAIIISDCTNDEGVSQEYLEIRKRFKEFKLIRQSLLMENDKAYDRLEIQLQDGIQVVLFFDITDFFGKW